jgi:hypothetical protein
MTGGWQELEREADGAMASRSAARGRETVGSSSGRPEGAREGGWRRKCASSREGDRLEARDADSRCEREAGSSSRGRPAEGHRREGRREGFRGGPAAGVRGGPAGARAGAWPASLSMGKSSVLFQIYRDLKCEESESGGGFCNKTIVLTARHLFRTGGSIYLHKQPSI